MSSLITRPPILVVEPDLALRTSITYTLRKELLTQVWGYTTEAELAGDTHTVSVHIHWLRQLLEENPEETHLIQTVHGIGYRFREEPK